MLIDWILAYWWLLLLEGLIVAGIVGALALAAPRLVGREPSSLARLRASMILTLIATFTAYIGLLVGVAKYLGGSGAFVVEIAVVVSALIIILQWLFSPYLINAYYHTRPPATPMEYRLQEMASRLARASGVSEPKLVIAESSVPNAFAYGSPLTGNYVAVTRGLLRILRVDEVEAVIGHEVGHLKHRDVSWILALSIVPLAVYFLGRMLVYAGLLGGGDRREQGSPLLLAAIGAALIAASILFRFLIAHFNRLREYYADAHSALVTGRPRSLQRALAKIYYAMHSDPRVEAEAQKASLASALFIVAPLVEASGGYLIDPDTLVERLKREEESPLAELFSTHPPISKRLRFLDRLAARIGVEIGLV